MADFVLSSRNPALVILTKVAEASTVTNNSGSIVSIGSIVELIQGNKVTQVLDADTLVEVSVGGVANITPVAGALGIGMYTRDAATSSTSAIVVDANASTRKAKRS